MNTMLRFAIVLGCLFAPATTFAQSKAKLEKNAKEPKPGEERVFNVGNNVKMTFCWIPGTNGKATLGSPEGEAVRDKNAEKEHEVELDGFWMAKTEMTQSQYVKLTGKKNPSFFSANGKGKDFVKGIKTDDFPVEGVSWDDAQECIKRIKVSSEEAKRIGLPSEAQWEWACRGGKGNGRAFYFGDILNGDQANCDGSMPYGTTTKGANLRRTEKVGSYAAKAPHPWGLCDMHGNVFEMCEDWGGDYRDLPNGKNPVQTLKATGGWTDVRVMRGGCWIEASSCRSAHRNGTPTGGERGDHYTGFRIVLIPRD